jgi:carboxylesterase
MNFLKGSEPFSANGTLPTGILVLHGYTGTTSSVLPLAKHFAQLGYHVECPRLAGHGTVWQDLNRTDRREWLTEIETALARLKLRCTSVFASGLSVGGLLTLYLAEKHPELKGIMLINPALFYRDPRLFLLPLLRFLMPAVEAVTSDIKDPSVKEIGYDRTPLQGLYQTTLLQKEVRKNLFRITQPTLILTSREDHVIPPENATLILDRISSQSKRNVWLENSYHVATLDYDRDLILSQCTDFIREHSVIREE